MRILLTGSGEISDYSALREKLLPEYDQVVAVDGGASHLKELNIQPNCLIGDFDSITEEISAYFEDVERIPFPPEKDFTDSELAFEHVLSFEPKLVHAVGFVGSRWDHSLSNLMLLAKYKDSRIVFVNEKNSAWLCRKCEELEHKEGHFLSLIPLTDIRGLNLSGVKYPLLDRDIVWPSSLTLSNEILDAGASISFKSGEMILVVSKD